MESTYTAISGGSLVIMLLLMIFLAIIPIVAMWKIFQKAGREGWEGIIPIYNIFILLVIIKKPWYWFILMMIPYVGIIWNIWSMNLLVKSFGKSSGFTVGVILLPFIFLPILAFGDAEYTSPEDDLETSFNTETETVEVEMQKEEVTKEDVNDETTRQY